MVTQRHCKCECVPHLLSSPLVCPPPPDYDYPNDIIEVSSASNCPRVLIFCYVSRYLAGGQSSFWVGVLITPVVVPADLCRTGETGEGPALQQLLEQQQQPNGKPVQ